MKIYNPDRAIDPLEWNNLDESERQNLVERYHRKKRIEIPDLHVHAIIHVIVENQVALDKKMPVKKTLDRIYNLFKNSIIPVLANLERYNL